MIGPALAGRCGAIAAGLLLDRVIGDPPNRLHPVAWFGSVMVRVERGLWADDRARGVAHASIGVAIGASAGRVIGSTPVAVAISVAGRSLRSAAAGIGLLLDQGDVVGARRELRALVGRDPSELDASGIAAAAIESVAENSVDAVVAPVFWALLGGATGTLAYRAVNTMDAMVGHRSDRHERYGWASARLDDGANYVPARIFALLVAVVRPGRARAVLGLIRRDAGAHPSPNAGVAETAMAAALGVELGGPLRYGDRVERRPTLGQGPRPQPADVPAAISVANRAELLLAGLLAAGAIASASISARRR